MWPIRKKKDVDIPGDREDDEGPLFDDDFPVLLENLSILVRKRMAGLLAGVHRSRQHGAGFEFSDHRAYQPGDDLRRLDWNVAARSDRWVIRRFEEEEDLYVYLVVDVSRSMLAGRSTGSPSCLRRALRMAAALSFAALVHQDPVSVFLVDDTVRGQFGPVRGCGQILRILDFLGSAESGGDTNLADALQEVVHRAPRKGLIVVLTDGFDEEGLLHGLSLVRHHGFEATLLRIADHRLRFEGVLGDLEMVDAETGQIVHLTLTPALAQEIRREEEQLRARLRTGARKISVTFQERAIQEAFLDSVIQALMGTRAPGSSVGRSDTSSSDGVR